MIRRPLVLALALTLLPAIASAEDLLQTYEAARQGDPVLSQAESSRLDTRENRIQARAQLLPSLSGEARLTRSRTFGKSSGASSDPTLPSLPFGTNIESNSTQRNYSLNASQMIYNRAAIKGLQSQNALSEASDFTLESANQELITRTSQTYFNVLVALENLAAAEAAETALQKQFDYTSKRLEVGLAPITDVHEARAQYDDARARTIISRNTVEDSYQALSQITGQPVRSLKALPADFKPALPEAQNMDTWVNNAIQNNPSLRAQELAVRSSEINVETARAGHWPTLSLGASYGDSATWGDTTAQGITEDNRSSGSRGPSVGLTLSVPLYSGGAVQSGVRQALARRDSAQDEFERQKRLLVRNTRNAYQVLVAGISEVEARRLAVVSAQAAYDASQVGLEVGTRTVLDVLNNQRTLLQAQQAYAQSKYNFLQNRLLLEQSAGSLDVADVQDINRLLTADAATNLAPPPATVQ
ncbi:MULTISPECIES: TolC family outer membrane protein [unclassified Lysobacter]|uniref:TolC family outer membrane protein n=1 Tax=unclassified Lysobacter TaxID=2635362 RepID=UPI001BE81A3C|nr:MULTISPECIES: TolC family outer membrane protein [unclassified Lysobacter]MBT2746336.1 TolC family outer membrane protein [Lysobacter sp. ISL-42]MBT2751191.1 TolC family outer membrane protein [Lysobacter sp. ISL-50]MBT2775599.1 TolC family outer membrane protein [Lysobacter sp. ISL-54]MBT2779984.1 TolC family outer membrane protein [Lysobacter sp. ISL-52]